MTPVRPCHGCATPRGSCDHPVARAAPGGLAAPGDDMMAEQVPTPERLKMILENVEITHPSAEAVRDTLIASHLEDLTERRLTKASLEKLADEIINLVSGALE